MGLDRQAHPSVSVARLEIAFQTLILSFARLGGQRRGLRGRDGPVRRPSRGDLGRRCRARVTRASVPGGIAGDIDPDRDTIDRGGAQVIPRSYLYVPGDRPDKLARAFGRGADALIVDLEDAVAPAARPAARDVVASWLQDHPPPQGIEVWIRVNPGADGCTDVERIGAAPWLTGVLAAKTENREELEALDSALGRAESSAGMDYGVLAVVPLLESATAFVFARELARGPRVRRLQVGEADLRADCGIELGDEERELLYVRSRLVLLSAALRLDPPVAPVSADFRNPERLRASTKELARLGFVGRGCIHPAQVPIVNEVFTPDPLQARRARELVERFERVVEAGGGVILDDEGRMLDEAIVRSARRIMRMVR